jgi:pyruvate,water dikinase
VVHSPSDIEGLSGCIMVAEKTDPGWTPIFPLAKAIIIERGSLLSHAAIVAREMGIPAIVSIPNVMNILKNDMWIQMDGSTGLISVLDEEDSHE